ncbi:MAG: hypothetical protein LUF87_08155 [Alistipes sp.]|nr:hypothetical protein [Alistipes sp.]
MSKISIVLVWLGMLFPVCAALPAGMVVNPNVVNFTGKEYGAGNKNWGLAQNSRGILYIANNDGLLEYDGTSWRLYTDAPCRLIRSVAIDDCDRIYTGGYEEFGYWSYDDKGTLKYHRLSHLVPENTFVNEDIWKIIVTQEGAYFQSFAKLYFYDYESVTVIDPQTFIMYLCPVRDRYFIHSSSALWELGDRELLPVMETGLNTVRVILPYGDENILLGTGSQGIYILSDGTIRRWGTEVDRAIEDDDLNCALRLENGDFIFGTLLNGLYHTDANGRILSHLSTGNFLANNTVLSLMADKDGNIWAGMEKGLVRLNYCEDFNFFIDHSNSLGSVYAATLCGDKLYVGTNHGLFTIAWEDFRSADAISKAVPVDGIQGQVWTLAQMDGRVLCGTNSGLFDVTGGKPRPLYENNGVFDLAGFEQQGRRYAVAATYSIPQIFLQGPHGLERSGALTGFSAPCAQVMTDPFGNVWLAHSNEGLFRCRPAANGDGLSKIVGFTAPQDFGMGYPKIRMGNIGGRIVFIVDDRFFLYDFIGERMVPYGELDSAPFLPGKVNKIVGAGADRYWMVGKNAVALFHCGEDSTAVIRQYNLMEMNLSTVDGFENVCILNDSLALVCLDNGFLIHDNRRPVAATVPDRMPFARQILALDKSGNADTLLLDGGKKPRIPYNSNNLVFSWSYPHVSGERVYFQYMLRGLDGRWSERQHSGTLRFDRLPRGDYMLLVRAVDEAGEAGPEAAYPFTVASPWYLSFIAFVCYGLVFVLAFVVLWKTEQARLRKRHIKRMQKLEKEYLLRQNEQLKTQVHERERDLMNVTYATITKNKVLSKIKSELDAAQQSGTKVPARLYNKLNDLVDNGANAEEDWKLFVLHFEQNHSGFFSDIKSIYPNLSAGDLKLCACLRLNLSTKDIASLLCISVRGVEIGRYRLRKKLDLETHVNLSDWLIKNF